MDAVARIGSLIAPSLEAMGFAVVRVKLLGGAPPTLQIMAERTSDHRLALEDCEKISRTISPLLDAEDTVPDAYNLEVSSPGIDRPLVRASDYARYLGHEAKIALRLATDGRKRFTGTLRGLNEDGTDITLSVPGIVEPITVSLTNIESAKLVLTDALLKAESKL